MPSLPPPLRPLAKSPRFTLLAVAIIGLGTGACSAVFSLFDSLMLTGRPGIVDEARLVDIGRTQEGSGFDNFSWPDYVDYRTQSSSFTDVAAVDFSPNPAGLSVDGDAQSASQQWVSPNFFAVLGTRLAAGRGFTEDGKPHGEIVISHRYWQRRFNSDAAIIGRSVQVNGHPVAIVGVAEPGFSGTTILAADFWMPLTDMELLRPGTRMLTARGMSFIIALGRLKPGVTVPQAQSDLALIAGRLAEAHPDTHRERGVVVLPSSRLPGDFSKAASAFLGVLGVLALLALLVASANIASLMLARGAARQREFAVRTALGADRRRLLRDLLLENLALFATGGFAGVLLCHWMVDAFAGLIPALPVSIDASLRVNPLAVVFTLALSLIVGLAFSLWPALGASRFDLLTVLRRGEQPAGGARVFSLRGLFLVIQLTFSLALLATAGALARSLFEQANANPGFDPRRVEFVRFDLTNAGLSGRTAPVLLDRLLAETRQLPGVERAAYSVAVPLEGSGHGFGRLTKPGAPADQPGPRFDWNVVSPGYFATLSIPLAAGRDFTENDKDNTPLVGIVNETLAERFWPGENAIGKVLLNSDGKPVEIVGVARNSKYRSISESPRGFFYAPRAQLYTEKTALFVKTAADASAIPQVRGLFRRLAPNLPIYQTNSLVAASAVGLVPQRIAASVALAAGFLTLVLAATGIYGVTLYWTATRTREFGVRLALGATRHNLLRLALSGSLRLVAVASVLGLAGAFGLVQAASSVLGRIPAHPAIFAGSAALFAILVVFASWLPARLAAKVNPVQALRSE